MKKEKKVFILVIVILIIAIILSIIFYQIRSKQSKFTNEEKILTTNLEKMDLSTSISLTGSIASSNNQSISTSLTGSEIKEISVNVGDYVVAGDTIIVFDTSDLEEELESVKLDETINNLKSSKSISDATEQVTNAENTYTTQATEQANNVSSTLSSYQTAAAKRDAALTTYQSAQTSYEEKKAQYEVILTQSQTENWKSSLEQKQATYDTAKAAYDEASVVTDIELTSEIYKTYETAKNELEQEQNKFSKIEQAKNEQDAANNLQIQALNEYNSLCTEVDSTYAKYQTALLNESDTNTKNTQYITDAKLNLEITNLEQQNAKTSQNNKVQDAEEKLGETVVTAPISGVITSINVEVGDSYTGGELFVIQDMQNFIVEASVDEYDISDIAVSMNAVIKTDATDDDELKGIVTFVSPIKSSESNASSNMGSASSSSGYAIEIALQDTDDRLRIGMTAKTSVVLDAREDVFAIAYDCVETAPNGSSYITVLDGEEQKNIVVEIGMESDYYVEIISDELTEGMKVIATPSSSSNTDKSENNMMDKIMGGKNNNNSSNMGGGFTPSGGGFSPTGGGRSKGF